MDTLKNRLHATVTVFLKVPLLSSLRSILLTARSSEIYLLRVPKRTKQCQGGAYIEKSTEGGITPSAFKDRVEGFRMQHFKSKPPSSFPPDQMILNVAYSRSLSTLNSTLIRPCFCSDYKFVQYLPRWVGHARFQFLEQRRFEGQSGIAVPGLRQLREN